LPHIPFIAIIDDDAAMREALTDLVDLIGYRSVSYESAIAFLKAADVPRPDCIILDVQMPGMSGLDLQQHLQREEGPPPIIFVTSFAEPDLTARAMKAGAHCVLSKPTPNDVLERCLREVLRGEPSHHGRKQSIDNVNYSEDLER
jgi:two-component system, LuxR family, response regulator FixJ